MVEFVCKSQSIHCLLMLPNLKQHVIAMTLYHISIQTHTSKRNLGLSGSKKYMSAPISEGRAEIARNSLQLWNLKSPIAVSIFSVGMMAQANPPHKRRPTIQKVDWMPR